MANLIEYIRLSQKAQSINELYTTPKDFSENYSLIERSEKNAYLRHFLVNNKPFAFDRCPLLFEQVVQYLSDRLSIPASNIKLIGSAKTGFSISNDAYGKPYTLNGRDLDFAIVSNELFQNVSGEFQIWKKRFDSKELVARNHREERFWIDNSEKTPRTIKRGFIDADRVPNLHEFPNVRMVNSCMAQIKIHLGNEYSIHITKASTRVYADWETFFRVLKFNTESVLAEIQANT